MNHAVENLLSLTEELHFAKQMMAVDVIELPKEVDWRKHGNRGPKLWTRAIAMRAVLLRPPVFLKANKSRQTLPMASWCL